MSELSHLVSIYPVPPWPKEWRSREGERRNLAEMGHIDASWKVPWASAGERETLNRLNMRWSWHLTDLALWNPEWQNVWSGCKVMQKMGVQWGVREDGQRRRMEPAHVCVCDGLNLVSPGNFIWWNPDSHRYGIHRWCLSEVIELQGWSLLNERSAFMHRDTQRSQGFPPIWGYNKKCVARKDPAWPCCGNPFHCL